MPPKKKSGSRTEVSTGKATVLESGEIIPPHGGLLRPAWKPGQSGNPKGMTADQLSAYFVARQICADASPEAARKQVALMSSEDERVAFMATEAVLNRGAGKPRDHSADDARSAKVDLSALSPDERTSLAALLRKALGS